MTRVPCAVRVAVLSFILALAACGSARIAASEGAERDRAAASSLRKVALPGATADGVLMDYIAYDPAHRRVWVPAGNTGSVDVIDAASDHVDRIEGFATAEIERRGQKRTVGPSAATVGDGIVYVGSRGDSSVCAIDAATLKVGACLKLDAMPDGLAYVASTKEVWVTTPRDHAIVVLDTAGPLAVKARIALDGQPEGFAVDNRRGVFFTNLEDKDRTLTIDLRTREITATWQPGCGEDGPKGLALDIAQDHLFVACSDHVVVLDVPRNGKFLVRIDTGDGVDNIDYIEARRQLFAAAGRAGRLTVARFDPQGALVSLKVVGTSPGARNAVATEQGVAYVTDASRGRILVVPAVPVD